MSIKKVIKQRRSYRSIDLIEITEEIITDLAESAHLAPSCKNSQPWRFIFVNDKNQLTKLFTSLIPGNQWIQRASMIIAVFSSMEYDCIVKERLYYLFDTGLATAFLILRATELGLVAHPIAGFDEQIVKQILEIPKNMRVITLLIVGKKSNNINPELTDLMKATETERPRRLPLKKIAFINKYNQSELD